MPHVELSGAIDLERIHRRFVPLSWSEGPVVTKAMQCYLAADLRTLLFECHTAEGYLRQSFFVLVTERPTGAMVRLHPRSAPEKTDPVKRCVARLATWLAEGENASIGNTNLRAALSIPFPPLETDTKPGRPPANGA